MLGLDQSGKSSLLSALTSADPVEAPRPTERHNAVSIDGGETSFDIWEVGGAGDVRLSWSDYLDGTDALVFVIDSANPKRLPEARAEVQKLIASPKLTGVPIVVIANKQDLPTAESPGMILAMLGLMGEDIGARKVHIMGTEVTPGNPCLCADDILRVLESLWQV